MRFLRTAVVASLMIGLGAGAFAAGPSDQAKAKSPVSVGEFAVMVASMTGGGRDLQAKQAVSLLNDKGAPLGDASASLTEGKLAEIMDFYGVHAKATTPTAGVNTSKAQAAAILIASSSLGRTAAASTPGPSPQTLDDCLALANHGTCVNCCKSLGTTSTKQCSQFCMTINKPSSSEPIP